ncbi:hypothetical protein WJX77_001585 [Trebouxia sp. C0004]
MAGKFGLRAFDDASHQHQVRSGAAWKVFKLDEYSARPGARQDRLTNADRTGVMRDCTWVESPEAKNVRCLWGQNQHSKNCSTGSLPCFDSHQQAEPLRCREGHSVDAWQRSR